MLGEDVGANEKPGETGVSDSLVSVSLDDELHLLASAFELS